MMYAALVSLTIDPAQASAAVQCLLPKSYLGCWQRRASKLVTGWIPPCEAEFDLVLVSRISKCEIDSREFKFDLHQGCPN
jgi:hypothetical protein